MRKTKNPRLPLADLSASQTRKLQLQQHFSGPQTALHPAETPVYHKNRPHAPTAEVSPDMIVKDSDSTVADPAPPSTPGVPGPVLLMTDVDGYDENADYNNFDAEDAESSAEPTDQLEQSKPKPQKYSTLSQSKPPTPQQSDTKDSINETTNTAKSRHGSPNGVTGSGIASEGTNGTPAVADSTFDAASATPPGSASRSITASVSPASDGTSDGTSAASTGPKLFLDLPDVTNEAAATFEEIPNNIYASKSLGNSGLSEPMACDCRPYVEDGINHACGELSDCVNRFTSIECLDGSGPCGARCRNQRFQRKEYANVSVIRTEGKGYGLRCNEYLPAGTFVYEYLGEVIDLPRYQKRMREYDERGIRHFYFMMLQKDEFIDATERGGLARFCNHSCAPNCYVDKWIVGPKFRMGIFTKRDVAPGEELTFDYNVDRYGAEAQPCYCGEPNCVGFIGGKTQTEAQPVAGPLAVALELAESDGLTAIAAEIKRHARKRRTTAEDVELLQALPMAPITMAGANKCVAALMKTRDEILLRHILGRIKETEDPQIAARLARLHGYEVFAQLLRDDTVPADVAHTILEIMLAWPKLTRNKIVSARVDAAVADLRDGTEDAGTREAAERLLAEWAKLRLAYRIPKRAARPRADEAQLLTVANVEAKFSRFPAVKQNFSNYRRGVKLGDSDIEVRLKLDGGYDVWRSKGEVSEAVRTRVVAALNLRDRLLSRALQAAGQTAEDLPAEPRLVGAVPTGPKNRDGDKRAAAARSREKEREAQRRRQEEKRHTRWVSRHGARVLPAGWSEVQDKFGATYYFNREQNISQWQFPGVLPSIGPKSGAASTEDVSGREETPGKSAEALRQEKLRQALEQSKRRAEKKLAEEREREAKQKREEEERKAAREEKFRLLKLRKEQRKQREMEAAKSGGDKSESGSRDGGVDSAGEDAKQKLTKMLAKYVPNIVARYEKEIGRDSVKSCARNIEYRTNRQQQIVHVLVEKDLKRLQETGKPLVTELDDKKREKVKSFVKDYMAKYLAKRKRSQGESADETRESKRAYIGSC